VSDHFRVAIDQLFANSPDATRTQDEKTFINEFVKQQFDLPRNLMILASLTVFVAIMAAVAGYAVWKPRDVFENISDESASRAHCSSRASMPTSRARSPWRSTR
jgi:cytosine/uracil/thiamine/allantoin permease